MTVCDGGISREDFFEACFIMRPVIGSEDSMQGWSVRWDLADSGDWDRLHHQAAGSLQQSWRYGQAMQALGIPCLRALVRDGDRIVGAAQFLQQRLPWFVRSALCSRGPLWHPELSVAQQAVAVEMIRKTLPVRRPRVAIFTPELEQHEALRAGNPCAGLRRVMTGYSTVLVDLRRNATDLRRRLDGNWRNRLVAVERSAVEVCDESADAPAHEAMVAAEWEQRRSRGYFSLPRAFVAAWRVVPPAEGATLLLSARLAGERAAAVLFLVHGRTATYHLGWTGPAGRQSHAHNLLMWRAFVALQDRGVEVLDLGGVDTVREPGIARFKIGTGGRVCTLVGSYA
jgi:hypothetical protein